MASSIQSIKNYIILHPEATKEELIDECERLEKQFKKEVCNAFISGKSQQSQYPTSSHYYEEIFGE